MKLAWLRAVQNGSPCAYKKGHMNDICVFNPGYKKSFDFYNGMFGGYKTLRLELKM